MRGTTCSIPAFVVIHSPPLLSGGQTWSYITLSLYHHSNRALGIGSRENLLYNLHLLQSPVAWFLEGLHPFMQDFFPSFTTPPYAPLNKGFLALQTLCGLFGGRFSIVFSMLNMASKLKKKREKTGKNETWTRDKIKKTFLKSIFVCSLRNKIIVSWEFQDMLLKLSVWCLPRLYWWNWIYCKMITHSNHCARDQKTHVFLFKNVSCFFVWSLWFLRTWSMLFEMQYNTILKSWNAIQFY